MEVLILGCGRVGGETAKALVKNNCQVTVVDTNSQKLGELQSLYDLRTVLGNAADPAVLARAGGDNAEIIIAVTAIDEVNLVACHVCATMFGKQIRIARLRDTALANESIITGKNGFDLDHAFCPEQIVADNVCDTIRHPGCQSVYKFTSHDVALASVRITGSGKMAGSTIGSIRKAMPDTDFRIMSLFRDGAIVHPDAGTRLFVGDEISLIVAVDGLNRILPLLTDSRENRHIMIAGGGNIGNRVAKELENEHSVKIIEMSQQRCAYLSDKLDNTLVLQGNASDEHMLREENIADTDIHCAITNDDEENILSSLLSKRLGARRGIVLINSTAYADTLSRFLDNVVSPSELCIGAILAHVRPGDVGAVHSLHHGKAEAIEVVLHGDLGSSQLAGRAVKNIPWPEGVFPGAIVRDDTMTITRSESVLKDGDRLILLVARNAIRKAEKLLQVGMRYF